MPGPETLVTNFYELMAARALDGAVALFAEDAVIEHSFEGRTRSKGSQQIRGFLNGEPGLCESVISNIEVTGDTATWTEVCTVPDGPYESHNEVTVEDGKIVELFSPAGTRVSES